MPSLQLYSGSSPNEFKVTIAPRELGLSYVLHHVHIDHGEQRHPEFLRLNPHGWIPVLVDQAAGITLFESAAILRYLAEANGRLLPDVPRECWGAPTWLTFHASSAGSVLGQRMHLEIFIEERYPPTIERYRRLSEEVFATLDQRPVGRPWLAGEQHPIVDIAAFGRTHTTRIVDSDLSHYCHLDDWHQRTALRPTVQRGTVLSEPAVGL